MNDPLKKCYIGEKRFEVEATDFTVPSKIELFATLKPDATCEIIIRTLRLNALQMAKLTALIVKGLASAAFYKGVASKPVPGTLAEGIQGFLGVMRDAGEALFDTLDSVKGEEVQPRGETNGQ